VIDSYAKSKLEEFVHIIFTGVDSARNKLSDNIEYLAIISPDDFEKPKHQEMWQCLQSKLIGKTRNIGMQRSPIDRLTVQNKTLELSLNLIWDIYQECK